MKAIDFLSRAYLLNNQINTKLDQIRTLHALANRMSAVLDESPVSRTRNVSAMEDAIARCMDAEAELESDVYRFFSIREEITSLLNQICSERYRLILEKRYLTFLSWEDIANDMNISIRWAQIKHTEALKVVQGLLDSKEHAETPPGSQ